MANVSAFVAHSFTEGDASHVSRLLEFLTRISMLNMRFTWVHAREAEPTELKEKVLRTAINANLLIAICSRKERVFHPNAARRSKINREELVIPMNQCLWATSDWITQEIGMAIGRDWKIILLVEDGVRTPGGMQGNLEYIQFERDAPERAFQSLMEMISSLTSDGSGEMMEQVSTGNAPSPSESAPLVQAAGSNTPVPHAEMTLDELETGVLNAYFGEDLSLLSQYDEVFRASAAGASEESRGCWEVRREWLNQVFKGNGSLATVRDLSARFHQSSTIAHYHALLLSNLGEADAAGAEFSRSAALVNDPTIRVRRLTDAATSFLKAEDADAANRLLSEARVAFNAAPSEQAELYLINAISEALGKHEKLLEAAVFERLVQLKPDNQDARFKLAYLYGDHGQSSLSLYQYLRIPQESRSAWAWNNLGVTYGTLAVKGKSVDAYEKAEALGNALATSNRARLLRDGGFLNMAETACQLALVGPEPDFNALSETLSSVTSQREEEQRKELEALSQAQPIEAHMRKLGAALIAPDISVWEGVWKGPKYEMRITATPDGLIGKAQYKRAVSKLRSLDMIARTLGEAPKAETVAVEVVAKTYGRAAYGKIEDTVGTSLSSILGASKASKVFLVMDEVCGVIQVINVVGDGDFKSFELQRVP